MKDVLNDLLDVIRNKTQLKDIQYIKDVSEEGLNMAIYAAFYELITTTNATNGETTSISGLKNTRW